MNWMSNLYNVCSYMWSLTLVALIFVIGAYVSKDSEKKHKRMYSILLGATLAYLPGLLLILTGIGVLVVIGIILHVVSMLVLLVGLALFLIQYFKVCERMAELPQLKAGTRTVKKEEPAAKEEAAGTEAPAAESPALKEEPACCCQEEPAAVEPAESRKEQETAEEKEEASAEEVPDVEKAEAPSAEVTEGAEQEEAPSGETVPEEEKDKEEG